MPTTPVKTDEANVVVVAATSVTVATTYVAAVAAAAAAVYVDASANTCVGIAVQLLLDRVDGAADDGVAGSTIAATLADDATDVVPA